MPSTNIGGGLERLVPAGARKLVLAWGQAAQASASATLGH